MEEITNKISGEGGRQQPEVLTVNNLSKSYKGKYALQDFSITLHKGEVVGLLGENGAGKSTAIECILGIKQQDSGTVSILGLDPVRDRKQVMERIGVQFQDTRYQDRITVEEVCRMTAALYPHPAGWPELLQRFSLNELRKRFVNDLSGGERQRLSVLLALIPGPVIVFLDELTTALDPRMRKDVLHYLEDLKRESMSMLLVSHFMDEVERLCDRVCILRGGRIVASGTIGAIISQSGKDNLEDAYLALS